MLRAHPYHAARLSKHNRPQILSTNVYFADSVGMALGRLRGHLEYYVGRFSHPAGYRPLRDPSRLEWGPIWCPLKRLAWANGTAQQTEAVDEKLHGVELPLQGVLLASAAAKHST